MDPYTLDWIRWWALVIGIAGLLLSIFIGIIIDNDTLVVGGCLAAAIVLVAGLTLPLFLA